jgi:hypothetical protein
VLLWLPGSCRQAAAAQACCTALRVVDCIAVGHHPKLVLCCAVLCCAVLCCAVLCCAVLCCAVLCCAVLCCAVLCCYLHECAEAKGALAIFTGNRALWSDALALWVQVRRYVFNSKEH